MCGSVIGCWTVQVVACHIIQWASGSVNLSLFPLDHNVHTPEGGETGGSRYVKVSMCWLGLSHSHLSLCVPVTITQFLPSWNPFSTKTQMASQHLLLIGALKGPTAHGPLFSEIFVDCTVPLMAPLWVAACIKCLQLRCFLVRHLADIFLFHTYGGFFFFLPPIHRSVCMSTKIKKCKWLSDVQ